MDYLLAEGESAVQDAIVAALAEYCYAERLRFRHTLPYANQQGFKPGALCADMAALLSNSILLILEVKHATTRSARLVLDGFVEKKVEQWKDYKRFEKDGIPVLYAFNTVDTLAHAGPGEFSPFTCAQTLTEIGLAKPSALSKSGEVGELVCNLFQYLRKRRADVRDASANGAVAADASVPQDAASRGEERLVDLLSVLDTTLSNSVLVLAFNPDEAALVLGVSQLRALHKRIHDAPGEIDRGTLPKLRKYLDKYKPRKDAPSRPFDSFLQVGELAMGDGASVDPGTQFEPQAGGGKKKPGTKI